MVSSTWCSQWWSNGITKWNDTKNPSYLVYLHFTAERLRAKWDIPRILRWFLNRTLLWGFTVSPDGDFSVAVRSNSDLHQNAGVIWLTSFLGKVSLIKTNSAKSSTTKVPLTVRKGPSVWLRLIKYGSWARLFRLLRRSVWEWWIKHLGHVAFFIRVHIWYALPFSWNYRLQDERGHDSGGMNHVGEDEIKKRISWQTSQGCVGTPEVPGVLFNSVYYSASLCS